MIFENFSQNDLRRGITIPKILSKDLAEEIGIHVGDGSLGIYKNGGSLKYSYVISGNIGDELYIDKFVVPLLYRLYHIKPSIYKPKNKKSIELHYQSKVIVYFKKVFFNLPFGKKDGIVIPKRIMNSDLKLDFIRGLFDTDGCLCFKKRHRSINYYPSIDIASKSHKLIIQISRILKEKKFKVSTVLNEVLPDSRGTLCRISRIHLYGEESLFRWMNLIGTSNPKKLIKFDIWKKYGYLPRDYT